MIYNYEVFLYFVCKYNPSGPALQTSSMTNLLSVIFNLIEYQIAQKTVTFFLGLKTSSIEIYF